MDSQSKSTEQLINFDDLPGSALVPLITLQQLYGVSRPTIHKMVEDGDLPQPIVLRGSVNRWLVSEVREAMSALTAGARGRKSVRGGFVKKESAACPQ